MTSARAFRLVVGLILLVGGLLVLFGDLAEAFEGPPLYMTALLVVVATGMVLIAAAFWTVGRPPDLPTGRSAPSPETRSPARRPAGWLMAVAAAVAIVVVLALLAP